MLAALGATVELASATGRRSLPVAEFMLGVTEVPFESPSDGMLRDIAGHFGTTETFRRTPVGVFFGEPGVTVSDPYFDGAGPVALFHNTGGHGPGRGVDDHVGLRLPRLDLLELHRLSMADEHGPHCPELT